MDVTDPSPVDTRSTSCPGADSLTGDCRKEVTKARIAAEYATFQRLVARASGYGHRGRPTAAAAYTEVAANFAFFRNPGIWVSHDLERELMRLGGTHGRPAAKTSRQRGQTASPSRVLHVATRVGAVGGHSRITARWIRQDPRRQHSLVLTKQGALEIPEDIVRAIADSGGSIQVLNRKPGSIVSWARTLRKISADYDIAILNIFADDIVPLTAFADKDSTPPAVFLDQADHAFWLGAGIIDVVASLRESGQRLAKNRRGIESSRSYLLPIPLSSMERTLSRAEAKRQLGLPEDSVLMLSIARAPKYATFSGAHYADPIIPVLQEFPKARLLVIGPDADEGWQKVHDATGGRVTALGTFSATSVYYQAADIYLDSFPINSITSLLEAASYGVPLISRQAFPATCEILGADAPGITPTMIRTYTDAEFADGLRALLGDEGRRTAVGDSVRRDVLQLHCGEGWRAQMEELYHYAMTIPRNRGNPDARDVHQVKDVDLAWSEVYRSEDTLSTIESYSVKRLPLDLRIRAVCLAAWQERRLRPGLLLPEWVTALFRSWQNAISVRGWRRG